MAFIVTVLFCGLSAGIVAKLRSNSFWIWFLIGMCLPLLGTLAALLYRREDSVEKRHCPECGSTVAIHDQVCMQCGNDLWLFEEPPAPVGRGA